MPFALSVTSVKSVANDKDNCAAYSQQIYPESLLTSFAGVAVRYL
jgi:hypothetical protein